MLLTSDRNQIGGTMSMDPPSSPSLGHLEAAVGAGDDRMRRTCAACARSVDKAVKRLPAIHAAAVDVL